MTPEEVGAGLHAALHAVVDAAIKEGMSLAEAIVAVSDVRETLNDIQENQRADAAAATRAAVPPVDRSQRTLADGSPVTPDHAELKSDGQQKAYVVLSEAERQRGFIRPLRLYYRHGACGGQTVMAKEIAETYARDPKFYSGTFCAHCRAHFPVGAFTWAPGGERVGT